MPSELFYSDLSRIYQQILYPKVDGGYYLTYNQYTKSEQLFIPCFVEGTEYYFVDYRDAEQCRWIRTPSQTFEEVGEIIKYIQKNNIKAVNFRVMPESFLSELKKGEWLDEKKEYKLDEITNRVYFFGNREESFAETFFGKQSLSRRNGETREDWIARITALEEEEDERLLGVFLNF